MTADQPAEATQPRPEEEARALMEAALYRYWTDAEFSARVKWSVSAAIACQPFRLAARWDRDSLVAGAAMALHVTDLRPAVVVPQREDEGEVERLAEVAHEAYASAAMDQYALWSDIWRGIARAVLAAQRPAAPVETPAEKAVHRAHALGFGLAAHPAPVGEVIHACPPDGSGRTPCCDRTPFELPHTDRITLDPSEVTCSGAPAARGPVDEATVVRVLGEHRRRLDLDDTAALRICCACGEWTPDDEGLADFHEQHAAHQAAEVVRVLAARDEDGGAS